MKQYNFEKLCKHQHSDTNIHGVILGNDYNYQNIELTSVMYKYTNNTDLKKRIIQRIFKTKSATIHVRNTII